MLRRMIASDAAEVGRIFKEGWPFGPTPSDNQIASKLQKWLVAEQYADPYLEGGMAVTKDAGFMSTLIGEHQGAIVGLIRWQLSGYTCVVQSMVVDPNRREQGFYKLMRDEGIQYMVDLGLTSIEFTVMPDVIALEKDIDAGLFEMTYEFRSGKKMARVFNEHMN